MSPDDDGGGRAAGVGGVAGRAGGAMPGKPVGLTWIALSARDADQAQSFIWDGEREANKSQSAEAALALLYDYLQGLAGASLGR